MTKRPALFATVSLVGVIAFIALCVWEPIIFLASIVGTVLAFVWGHLYLAFGGE